MNIPPLNTPHPSCPQCRGVGRIVLLTSAVECDVCRGTGVVKASCLYAMHEVDGVDRVNVSYDADVAKGCGAVFTLSYGTRTIPMKDVALGAGGTVYHRGEADGERTR
jgi:RecJ-like exonuclease